MENTRIKKSNIIFEWVVPIVIAFFVAFGVKQFLLYKVCIPSKSMEPTLNVGDQLLIKKVYNVNNIKRGDILVFWSEELDDTLIKRVIGLPGDTIKINDGAVSVNGEILNESYIKNNNGSYGEFKVPDGKYFFLGDNRADSYDSSRWKNPYIDASDIQGKAVMKIYPIKDFSIIR